MRTFCFLFTLVFFLSCQNKELSEPEFVPMELANIPAGSFYLGSDKGFVVNETPRITVYLRGFLMSRHEITQHQYRTVMNESPSFGTCDDCPVDQVSWFDALRFCNALSVRENLEPAYTILPDTVIWNKAANGYRLPTEAEWEYACKGGTDTDLFTGDLNALYLNLLDPSLDAAGWFSGNSTGARPVGQKQANAFGLYDLHGNVWEWCWDYYNHDRYMFMDTPATDPVDDHFSASRVTRGGSFHNDLFNARSALRYYELPATLSYAVGFRVVRNGQ